MQKEERMEPRKTGETTKSAVARNTSTRAATNILREVERFKQKKINEKQLVDLIAKHVVEGITLGLPKQPIVKNTLRQIIKK